MKQSLFFISFFLSVSLLFAQNGVTERMKISHQPYLQGLTDSTVSIVWTTNKPSVGWVEVAPDDHSHFYGKERPRFFDVAHGLKRVDTLHRVQLRGLTPNTHYRYRVLSQEVLAREGFYVQYGRTVGSDVYTRKPFIFKTAGDRPELHFFIVNDIHERNDLLHDLFSLNDLSSTDFVLFNGDMVNSMRSEKQMFTSFLDSAALLLEGKIPFYYARGNHETRGPFAAEYPAYFPTNNGKLYYAFSYGDAIFVVLDSGEDKPDSDLEYSGITDMDRYRSEQAEWLGKLVQTDPFRKAKYKIVISHMPPFGTWHGSIDLGEKVLPILNDVGIDIMLCAHLHTHLIRPADTVCRFPVIVNSNENLLKVTIDRQTALFRVLNRQGKEVERVVIEK